MNTDISFDLETLGVDPGCVITQIGACAFDVDDPIAERQMFNTFVDPQSCLDLGMTIKWSTIKWWLVQPEAARKAMVTDETVHISKALEPFHLWPDLMNLHIVFFPRVIHHFNECERFRKPEKYISYISYTPHPAQNLFIH